MDNVLSTPHESLTTPEPGTLPAAVLWDMDGTIIDTEPQWLGAEITLAQSYGATWTTSMGEELIGRALDESIEIFRARTGIQQSVEVLIDELIEEMIRLVARGEAQWRPGAVELLTDLAQEGVPCALVTMSYRGLADVVLDMLPEGIFDAVVTGDQVTMGKPHPEAYLTAANRLGVDVRQSVALEDSIAGITSAAASGAWAIAVPAHQEVPVDPSYAVIPTLAEVKPRDLFSLAARRGG